jgi:hypothetical protein
LTSFVVVLQQWRWQHYHLLQWFCYKKKATVIVVAFFNGFVAKKMTTTMSLPSFMVVVLWRKHDSKLLSPFFFPSFLVLLV